ncbi:hypothetical protein JL721_13072 [Aureococcus anophagefferens]|nr:hypothetical protein JL721_13072 [Aureococcus anophagefferens]
MAFFARSPKKKPSPKKYAKDWKAESDAETDAAARLNKVMAKLEGITPERDEKSLDSAYALTQAVADVSLGDLRHDGLAAPTGCAALKGLATHEPSPPCAALHDALLAAAEAAVVPVALAHESAPSARRAPADAAAERAASAEAAGGSWRRRRRADRGARGAGGRGRRGRQAAARRGATPTGAAAALGLLGGAARSCRGRAAALESGGLVDVGRLAGLLAHDASAAPGRGVCLQRRRASEGLGDVALGAIDVARRPDDWRWTEGALMAYDGVLSDEASAATERLGDGGPVGGVPGAAAGRLGLAVGDARRGSFEVRRAPALAFSSGAISRRAARLRGRLGFLVDPAVPPSHRALGARLLAHGVSFGRFCDEALADAECTPLFRKWGLSHEGAGGDSEAVSKAEAAVRDAARARPAALRRRVGALRLAVLGAPDRRARSRSRLARTGALGGLFRAVSFRGAADDLSPRKRKAGVARAVVAGVPGGAGGGRGGGGAAFRQRGRWRTGSSAPRAQDADLSARLLGALALAALLSAPSAEDPPDDWDDWDDDDDAPDCGGGDEDDDALDAERALTAAIDAEAARTAAARPSTRP